MKIITEDQANSKGIFNATIAVDMDIWQEIALSPRQKNHRESSKLAISVASPAILQGIALNKNENGVMELLYSFKFSFK